MDRALWMGLPRVLSAGPATAHARKVLWALGRTKLPRESIEQIEQAVRKKLEVATGELNKAIDGAELLLKNNNIEIVATYDTVPLEVEIGITSALGRRYFELIHKLDQVMPLLQTLEIEEVVNEQQAERQRSNFKRIVLAMSSTARNFSMGVRRRMNEADAQKGDAEDKRVRAASDKIARDAVAGIASTRDGIDQFDERAGEDAETADIVSDVVADPAR